MIDKAALKAEAFRLGFWLCGVTTPEPPTHLDTYHRLDPRWPPR